MRLIEDAGTALALWREKAAGQAGVEPAVREIVEAVRREGLPAVLRYTERLDGVTLTEESFRVGRAEMQAAYDEVGEEFLSALRQARERVLAFHRRQAPASWLEPDGRGNLLGQLVRPLARVGIYVPGGSAAYPSSVLMNALPARAAGVGEIAMVTPPGPEGRLHPAVLVAAAEAGVDEVYRAGGAQAIAALAYGAGPLRPVDKICGPGNVYVTAAKRLVFGQVDLDMLAGPSEVVVVADGEANPEWLAADLIAQAEHDPRAAAWLITPSARLARKVIRQVAAQLKSLPRRGIAGRSLKDWGAAVVVPDLAAALALAGELSPEHLELAVSEPFRWLGQVKNAGAVFLGQHTPEPVGDYLAGPSHVLPTGGTARFFSPLGVEDFVKRTSVIYYAETALQADAVAVSTLAEAEGLTGHANAVRRRVGLPALTGEPEERGRGQVEEVLAAPVNKSEKIRRLLALGLGRSEVARLLGVRYQFVYNVERAVRAGRRGRQ